MSEHLPTPSTSASQIQPAGAAPASLGYPLGSFEPEPSGSARAMIRRITAALRRYKWLVAAIALVGLVAGAAAARLLVTPQYAAGATLWIEARQPGEHSPIQTNALLTNTAWMDLLRSNALLDPVVHELRLYLEPSSPADSAALATLQIDDRLVPGAYRVHVDRAGQTLTLQTADGRLLQEARVGEVLGAAAGFRWVPPAAEMTPGRRIEFRLHRPGEISRQLGSELVARMQGNGNFLAVGLLGPNPQRLASTLDAITVRFVSLAGELKRAQSEELTAILREQLEQAGQNLRESEAQLQGFRVNTVTLPSDRVIAQAPGLQATQGTVFTNFFGLKMDRDQLRREREAIQAALARGSRGPLPVPALEVVPSVQQSSELSQALAELTAKRAELRAMQNQFTNEYLPVQRLSQEVQTLERQAIPRLAAQLIAEIQERESEMDSRLSSASGELRQIPERSIEEARLERSVDIAADLYTMLSGRYESARLAAVSAVPDVRVLDAASVSGSPVNSSDRMRIFLMFFLGSLGLAIGAPVLLDRMDSRLRYPEQVTNEMGLPILGAVPHVASASGKRRRIERESTGNAVEAFREIRLNLSHAFGAAGPLMTTVTSPGMGDGKSFITSNLALAFADLGHRTLLIDGDIRRGQLHRLLGGVRVPGLTDFLSGTASAEEIVQPTAYDSLDLIAGGTRMQAGPELLGSSAMVSLIRDLRTRYSVILIDSPPLGAGVDPFVLSTLTGNAMLVMRNGRTDREFALSKLELLDRLPVRLLGAVLNDVPATGAYRYYSYLPGYGAESEAISEGREETRQLEGV